MSEIPFSGTSRLSSEQTRKSITKNMSVRFLNLVRRQRYCGSYHCIILRSATNVRNVVIAHQSCLIRCKDQFRGPLVPGMTIEYLLSLNFQPISAKDETENFGVVQEAPTGYPGRSLKNAVVGRMSTVFICAFLLSSGVMR